MLTILTVTKKQPSGMKERLSSLFRRQNVTSEVRGSGGLSVLYVNCEVLRGYPDLKKAEALIPPSSRTVLCSKDISLKGTKLSRFESFELNKMLLKKQLSEDYSGTGGNLRAGLYDPEADQPSFLEPLIHCFREVTVVSSMPRFYEIESERIAGSTGAVVRVSNSLDALSPCDVIVCPGKINRPLPTVPSTKVYTICRPLVSIPGQIIYEYDMPVPEELQPLIPDGFDKMYFLSAVLATKVTVALPV